MYIPRIGGLSEAQVNALIAAAIVAAVNSRTPIAVVNLIGNRSITQLNALTPAAGDAYVAANAGTPAAGVSDALVAGSLTEYNGTAWKQIVQGVGGFVPNGTRAALSTAAALVSPYTDGTIDGAIILFGGASNTGTDTLESTDGASVVVNGEQGVNENKLYIFDGVVPTGAWIAPSSTTVDNVTIEVSGGALRVKDGGISAAKLLLSMAPTWTGAHSFNSNLSLFAALAIDSAADVTIAADQNNYNFADPGVVQGITASGAVRTFTGFIAQNSGRIFILVNAGALAFILAHEHASSTAANRIKTYTGTDVTVQPGQCAFMLYDDNPATVRWRVLWASAGTVPDPITSGQMKIGTNPSNAGAGMLAAAGHFTNTNYAVQQVTDGGGDDGRTFVNCKAGESVEVTSGGGGAGTGMAKFATAGNSFGTGATYNDFESILRAKAGIYVSGYTVSVKTIATLLTISDLLGHLITGNPGGGANVNYQLPTGTNVETGTAPGSYVGGMVAEWTVINLSVNVLETITITGNTAHNIVGSPVVAANSAVGQRSEATFITVKNANNDFTTYRKGS